MSDKKQEIISQCHTYLEETLGKVISSDAVALYYKYANELVNSLLERHKETIQHYDMYGVALSGCVQKRLAIPGVSCGYLVFFYEKNFDHNNLESFQTRNFEILTMIETHIKEMNIDVE
ncbi:hypothetical protein RFI_29005, partial [Reticulomyxa filosa]